MQRGDRSGYGDSSKQRGKEARRDETTDWYRQQQQESYSQSMGARELQIRMRLDEAERRKERFLQEQEAAKDRYIRDPTYKAMHREWAKEEEKKLNDTINDLNRQIEQTRQSTTAEASKTGPGYGYNPYGEGYSYGAVPGGGDLSRMNTIGRSQQYDIGYYGSPATPEGGHQDSTQRSSFVEDALRREQEQLAQQDQQWLAQQNPEWLAEQERKWSDEQRQQRGRRRPPNQDG